jgi:hypothetical protein
MGAWMHRHRQLFCAIGLSLWPVITAGSQAPASEALSAPLRDQVKAAKFGIVTSIRGLPLGIRDRLQTMWGSQTLDIAEPGTEFQGAGANVNRQLPARRLAAAGCTIDLCIVYYERGGATRTWHVALFHWTPAETRFEWGGTAPGGLTTIDAVRNAILSGAIKSPSAFW